MMQLITADRYGEFVDALTEMHRLRYRVFRQRLGWDVEVTGDMEIDEFDSLHPAYLLHVAGDGQVRGCVRLLPSTGPTMLAETFPDLLDGAEPPACPATWESSRFAIDLDHCSARSSRGIATATHELFAGMIEFGLSRGLRSIVTVTDARLERILRRAGWPLRAIGRARRIGPTIAVAGHLDISPDHLARVRERGGLAGPVLWQPVDLAAA